MPEWIARLVDRYFDHARTKRTTCRQCSTELLPWREPVVWTGQRFCSEVCRDDFRAEMNVW